MSHGLIDSSSSFFFLLSYHHFSSYLFVHILCSIICLFHCISFYAMSDDLSHFSAWRTVMSLSTLISWTLVRRSLVKKVIFSERVHVHHCLRVYPFHYVLWKELISWYSEYVWGKRKKEEVNKRMYIVSFFIECIYWSFRLLYWVSCLWKFVCELLRGYHLLVSISLCILRVRDKWPFPRDSGSLSSPSLHTLVFDYSPWLDLSGLLIHFLSIYLFFSSYLIRLVYIVLYSYWFTFCIQYFPHIILIHSISS